MDKLHAIAEYFQTIWSGIISTLKGMSVTLHYFFAPAVTMRYPEEKPVIPKAHRGIHVYNEEQCILCNQCIKACPVDCIVINGLGRGKDNLILQYDIDYSKCLFCNLCCEACAPKCLFLGEEYDRAAATKAGCLLHFARIKDNQQIEKFKLEFEQREAERKQKALEEAARKKAQKESTDGNAQ